LSQIKKDSTGYYAELHTKLKLLATVKFLKENLKFKVLLQGGYNFGVRYNDQEIIESDFSFSAFALAREMKSEANYGREFLIKEGINEERILIEEISATSKESALIASILLLRTTFDRLEEIKIFSLTCHLKKIVSLYRRHLSKKVRIRKEAIEKYLSVEAASEYYSEERGGKKWKVLHNKNKVITVVLEE